MLLLSRYHYRNVWRIQGACVASFRRSLQFVLLPKFSECVLPIRRILNVKLENAAAKH